MAATPYVCSVRIASGVSEELSCKENIRTLGAYPVYILISQYTRIFSTNLLTSPTAKKRPSELIDTQVAALILSLLDHVFDEESPDSKLVCAVDGAYGIAASRNPFPFLPSLALLAGVEGPAKATLIVLAATAVGEARKKRCECFPSSSISTTTTAAPAVYANIRDVERQSKHGGEETVVPIIFFNDNPNS